jgi:acyl-CoA reductase-like NAD-dependent aldehyde dehydrogenase
LQAIVLGEAAEEAEFPSGVVNVVPEIGSEGGELLTRHRAVDLVSFTGSTAVGRAIAGQAAGTLKRLILELGGKSVQLHLPDIFTGDTPGQVASGAFSVYVAHAGQGCALQTRMLVPEADLEKVIETVAGVARTMTMGDPADAATLLGPLITRAHRDRVHDIVTRGIEQGGRLITGGNLASVNDRGWYYEPTLLALESNSNPAAQEEIFGPVITVQGYRDIEHAIEIANDSELGLSGGVYTDDLNLGLSVAERIRSGSVQVNTGWASGYTPMGGYKQSGYGNERGAAGIRAFQNLKHIVLGSR